MDQLSKRSGVPLDWSWDLTFELVCQLQALKYC